MHGGGQGTPSERDLRKFGLSTGAAFALILGLLVPWLFSLAIPLWPFVLGVALAGPALLVPRALRPVHLGWMWGAERIGAFNSRLLLGVTFYAVLTPIGWIRRRLGSDPLSLRPIQAASFRKPSRPRAPQSMERPF